MLVKGGEVVGAVVDCGGTADDVGGGDGGGLSVESKEMRASTLGVPHPVVASQPISALNPCPGQQGGEVGVGWVNSRQPLLPMVMSWNAEVFAALA